MKLKLEVWNSDHNKEERHYFSAENETYLFGYNPLIVPEEKIASIKAFLESEADIGQNPK